MKLESYVSIFLRYVIIVLVALPNLYLFYLVFTPLTLYPTYFLINLFSIKNFNTRYEVTHPAFES